MQARILMIFLNYGLVIRDPLIESTYYETIPFFADRCYFPFRYVEGISADKSLKPNIVFILCDDMGYGDLGCYGQKYIQTPHFNRMAQEGMRFTQAYAGSPVSAGFL